MPLYLERFSDDSSAEVIQFYLMHFPISSVQELLTIVSWQDERGVKER
jgi:hypothetical protein